MNRRHSGRQVVAALVVSSAAGAAVVLTGCSVATPAARHHVVRSAPAVYTRTPGTTTTTTTPPPPVTATTTTTTTPAPDVPPMGRATAWGCGPALAYIAAYAAPGFTAKCSPGDAQGAQATTCVNVTASVVPGDVCGPGQKLIKISEPCPAAYMNETFNSWVVMGEAPPGGPAYLNVGLGQNVAQWIDPYGACP